MTVGPVGCGHNVPAGDDCHHMSFIPCPVHFGYLYVKALNTALNSDDPTRFLRTLQHLVTDRILAPAYFTWMAMVGRYLLPEGVDRGAALSLFPAQIPAPAPGTPPYLSTAMPVLDRAMRAAVANNPDGMERVLDEVSETLDPEATLSFMMSVAGSAAANATFRGCGPDRFATYALLGSQVSGGVGAAVLPLLVDMVLGHMEHDETDPHAPSVMGSAADLFRKIIQMCRPGSHEPIVVAVDIVSRALAQTLEPDITVIDDASMSILDIDSATPDNTSPEAMSAVWAVRASRAYATASSPAEATRNIMATARACSDDAMRFAIHVVIAGTQMLASSLRTVESAGSPG